MSIITNESLVEAQALAAADYELKLRVLKRCAICGYELGDLNGPEGEEPLKMHFEANHPGEPLRMEVVK